MLFRSGAKANPGKESKAGQTLVLDATAKTFRYLDEEELAQQKRAAAATKKGRRRR